MSNELKPCAHCGGKANVYPPTCNKKTPYDPADRAFPIVRCSECYASVPGASWDNGMSTAIEAWNRRKEVGSEH